MNFFREVGSPKKEIIVNLKKNGGMTIDELSRVISITPMGIRQHLLSLEKKGLVTYVSKKRGIGRPGFVYMITDQVSRRFPHAYDEFALDILRDIKKHEGEEKVDAIFGWRSERILNRRKNALAGKDRLEDRISAMVDVLESEGYYVELSQSNGNYYLEQFHCPIQNIASEFSNPCNHELQIYRHLFGSGVWKEQSRNEGHRSCMYGVPAH